MFQQIDVSQGATCITKGGSLLTVTLQYHIKPKLQIKIGPMKKMKLDTLQMVTLGYLKSMMAAFLQFNYRTGAGKKSYVPELLW